jgi:hypothetical protein
MDAVVIERTMLAIDRGEAPTDALVDMGEELRKAAGAASIPGGLAQIRSSSPEMLSRERRRLVASQERAKFSLTLL